MASEQDRPGASLSADGSQLLCPRLHAGILAVCFLLERSTIITPMAVPTSAFHGICSDSLHGRCLLVMSITREHGPAGRPLETSKRPHFEAARQKAGDGSRRQKLGYGARSVKSRTGRTVQPPHARNSTIPLGPLGRASYEKARGLAKIDGYQGR